MQTIGFLWYPGKKVVKNECFYREKCTQKKDGNLSRIHIYMIKLSNTALQWRGMTHWLYSLMKISSLKAMQFSFL